jgi:hypothetical protein
MKFFALAGLLLTTALVFASSDTTTMTCAQV